jgi:outer membrane receptor protein involved in Fe transport
MSRGRLLLTAALAAAFSLVSASGLSAQGVTTGAISGIITSSEGLTGVEGAQVQVTNTATGYTTGSLSRANGLYMVQGLEVGGPYIVRVRLIGFEPAERGGITVTLGRATRVDITLTPQAVTLGQVVTTADANAAEFSPSRQGVGTAVGDTIIRRLPTLQRDFLDLVKLTPQVVTNTGGGPSAAGADYRSNNFTVDGANQNDRFNLTSTGGTPGGATGGRVMSQEAVKEFQVLMSPTDVRYGNFAGMLINAVTKTGTNDLQGGAIYMFRTPGMARDVEQIRSSGFEIKQYGFHLGGPIIKDRLHFFIAPEWQQRTDPTSGPSIDAAGNTVGTSTVKVSLDSIARIGNILAPRFDVGSAGAFPRGNPLTNLMGRLDWFINPSNRLTFRVLDNTAEQDEFSRNTFGLQSNVTQQSSGIRLTSNSYTRKSKNRSFATQLFTNLARGMSNEFLMGYNTLQDVRIVPVNVPEISVGVTPDGGTSPSVAVTMGTERFSPGNDLKQKIFEMSENLTIPFGTHTFTVGGRYEHTSIYNYFLSGAGNGAYTFSTIADLEAGTPRAYAFSYANGGPIAAEFSAQQFSAYAQDLWSLGNNFSITAGLRVDVPHVKDTPANNPNVTAQTSEFRTDVKPKVTPLWSPRVGFNWDVTGRQTTQLRGNIGVFTGQAPLILIGNAFSNTGLGGVTVGCSGSATPAFTTDVSQLPTSCAGQPAPAPGQAGTVGINITDKNFKYPQNFTTSLGFDHWLPGGFLLTLEGLFRKDINPIYTRDANLAGPRMVGGNIYTDRDGRVLYADTITVSGTGFVSVQNSNQKIIRTIGSPPVNFSEGAIMLANAKAGHNYSMTSQLRKRFSRAFEATGAYTYMQARDVQSITSDRAISIWRFGRQHAGLENDPNDAQVSNFQRPHRIIAYGTYTAPWRRFQTDVSLYFEGVSGSSIVYTTNADINGDGVGGNDPIYVPRDATDPNEIRIGTGNGSAFVLDAESAAALERFIELQPCLNSQRGQIMKRNSCQGPFQKRMDFSLRQTLPEIGGQRLTAQLDVFNFLNLLNKDWGQNKFPNLGTFNNLALLQVAGRSGSLGEGQWDYRMAPAALNGINNDDSPWSLNPNSPSNNYQMQLTVRYAF